MPKTVLPFLVATSHWSCIICPYLCGVIQCRLIQSYNLFSPHIITLASGKVRCLSRLFLRESSFICLALLETYKSQLRHHLVPHTHFKAAVNHFSETKASDTSFQQPWAGVTYYAKPTHYFLKSGHHLSIFWPFTLNIPKSLLSQSNSNFARCKKCTEHVNGDALMSTTGKNLSIWRSLSPWYCVTGLDTNINIC